jgi:hypothetical protein
LYLCNYCFYGESVSIVALGSPPFPRVLATEVAEEISIEFTRIENFHSELISVLLHCLFLFERVQFMPGPYMMLHLVLSPRHQSML